MSGRSRQKSAYFVSAYAMSNAIGRTAGEILASLAPKNANAKPSTGLSAPPMTLPFETLCGVVWDLPALPPQFASVDSRMMRLAALSLEDMLKPIERAIARYGASRVGAVIGTSTGGLARTETAFDAATRAGGDWQMPPDFSFDRMHPFSAVVEFVRARSGFGGPGYVVSTACSSSAKAFASAERLIRAGVCDAVIVGGVDTLCQTTVRGFHSLGVLAKGACRPFAQDRDGISIGEGGAFLLLERGGDGPVQLLGVGESMDAHHMSAPDPSGLGARSAMERAIAQAEIDPSDVDHVNAHGTGTKQNDSVEARAIADVLGTEVPVASTKGYTGHLLGAGGAMEAAIAILSIEHGFIPASLGADPVAEDVAINVTREVGRERVRIVLSNSFAFGGSNASVLLGAS